MEAKATSRRDKYFHSNHDPTPSEAPEENLHSANKCLRDNRNWWCRTWPINLLRPEADSPFFTFTFCLFIFSETETRRQWMMIWTSNRKHWKHLASNFVFRWINGYRAGLDRKRRLHENNRRRLNTSFSHLDLPKPPSRRRCRQK